MKTYPDPEKTVLTFLETLLSTTDTVSANGTGSTVSGMHFLAAVSGGADSVFLLAILHRVLGRLGGTLSAVTVNHRMRSEAESGGDASFVQKLCASLEPPVPCYRIDLDFGAVASLAEQRGKGEEDAARILRYSRIRELAHEKKCRWICTGHTKNDQLETLLMRTIQGSGTAGRCGIAAVRGDIIRPLIGVERPALEHWLTEHGFSWREDCTNTQERYLRNRIRSRLVPLLDSVFHGWKTGMLAGAGKAALDEDFIQSFPLPEWDASNGRCSCESAAFFTLHPALRLRFLQKGLITLGVVSRIPYQLLEQMIKTVPPSKQGILVSGAGIRLVQRESSLFLESDIVQNGKSGYLVYIASCGEYELPFGTLCVSGGSHSVYLDNQAGPFTLPLIVRSRQSGDAVRTAGGGKKTVKKLMNDWSVREKDRSLLPLIECGGMIQAVYGTPLGYPHWYVHL